MKQLYLECYSGISGDMTVGALLDLGASEEKLREVLASVPEQGFEIRITKVAKSGIMATDFDVILEEDNHDHDMAYLFGRDEEIHEHHHHHHHDDEDHDHDHEHHHHHHDHDDEDHDHHHHHDHDEDHDHHHHHDHDEEHHHHHHDHDHDHDHDHGHHHHDHVHRSLPDVNRILDETKMTEGARAIAKEIFLCVARAEAFVHGKPIEEVHFHEVGAIDSIVDIISIAVLFDDLKEKEGFSEVVVPVLYEGCGTIRCQHGVIPIPVPAVTAIARESGLRLHLLPDEGEFVTPTGAAACAVLRTTEKLPDEFRVLKTGLGAGKRAYRRAGVTRMHLIEA